MQQPGFLWIIYEKWGLSAKIVGPQMCRGKSVTKSEREKGKVPKKDLKKRKKARKEHERIYFIKMFDGNQLKAVVT